MQLLDFRSVFIMMVASFLSFNSYASPIAATGANLKGVASPTKALPQPSAPLAPADFNKAANTMQVQNQNQLSQQAKQLAPTQKPATAPAGETATDNSTPDNGIMKTTKPAPQQNYSIDNQPSTTASPTPTFVPQTATKPLTAPSTPAATQSNTYTGFGSGAATQPASNSSNSNSGGWNVKY